MTDSTFDPSLSLSLPTAMIFIHNLSIVYNIYLIEDLVIRHNIDLKTKGVLTDLWMYFILDVSVVILRPSLVVCWACKLQGLKANFYTPGESKCVRLLNAGDALSATLLRIAFCSTAVHGR